MKKQLRVIGMLIRMKLSHMMMVRLRFFGVTLIDGSLFLLQLLVFSAIYNNVESIGGWSRGQMTIFIGTFSLINALNMAIYFFGVIQIPDMIIQGGLDTYLTKPVNPLLRITFERVNPGSLPLVALSVLIILYGAGQLDAPPTGIHIAGYVVLVILMTVLWYDMELLLRCIPFFVTSTYSIGDTIEGSLLSMNFQIPGTLYKGVWKILFYFVLPYGIMSTLPTQMLAGALNLRGFAYGVGIVGLFTCLALGAWRAGLKRYQSASS